jgi:hypothetical protein
VSDQKPNKRNGISLKGNDADILLALHTHYLTKEKTTKSTSFIYREGLRALAEKLRVDVEVQP